MNKAIKNFRKEFKVLKAEENNSWLHDYEMEYCTSAETLTLWNDKLDLITSAALNDIQTLQNKYGLVLMISGGSRRGPELVLYSPIKKY